MSIRHSVSPHTGVTSPHTEEIKPDTALKGTEMGQLPPKPSHGKKQKIIIITNTERFVNISCWYEPTVTDFNTSLIKVDI